MPRTPIPERQPIGDAFTGMLIAAGYESHLLAVNGTPLPENMRVSAQGEFTVRYGLAYLGKPHIAIVPGLLALDYGDMLVGDEAFTFILTKSNLYPRADVLGYRNDGTDEMIPVKKLDLAIPLHVLVYDSPQATHPLARADALIAPAENTLSPRLLDYITRYETVAAWQAAREDNTND